MHKSKKGVPRKPAVDYKKFVKAWVTATTLDEVAKKFNIETETCTRIAHRLRKDGVKLRAFPRRRTQPIDAKMLNRLIGE